MRATFSSLPQNAYGNVNSAAARYLLHRHFQQQRGWLMTGLRPDEGDWNASFPVELLQELPSEAAASFQHRLTGPGLTLHEMAVLAAMLEDLVNNDGVVRLQKAWELHGFEANNVTSIANMEKVIETFALTYMMDELKFWPNITAGLVNRLNLEQTERALVAQYPGWSRTQKFLRFMLKKALTAVDEPGFRPGFQDAERVVQQLLENFGLWQDGECEELKSRLVSLETKPGHVELVNFYSQGLHDNSMMFTESEAYLRRLGVLDESDKEHSSVRIPNYISSAANHIGKSRYFELACVDSCDLGSFERLLHAPSSTASELAAVVKDLHTDGQQELTDALMAELAEAADAETGKVALHGRPFAKWLHRAYPRDCPSPPAAGTTKQWQPLEYEAKTGLPSFKSSAGLLQVVSQMKNAILSTVVSTPTPTLSDATTEAGLPALPPLELPEYKEMEHAGAVQESVHVRSLQAASPLPFTAPSSLWWWCLAGGMLSLMAGLAIMVGFRTITRSACAQPMGYLA